MGLYQGRAKNLVQNTQNILCWMATLLTDLVLCKLLFRMSNIWQRFLLRNLHHPRPKEEFWTFLHSQHILHGLWLTSWKYLWYKTMIDKGIRIKFWCLQISPKFNQIFDRFLPYEATLLMFCLLNPQTNACEPNPKITSSDFNRLESVTKIFCFHAISKDIPYT